nr:hypothetical protein [Tanacetum cinerariifolium]
MSTLTPSRYRWKIVYSTGPKRWICPKNGWRMIRTPYRHRVLVEAPSAQVKEKSPKRAPEVELEEEDPKEDPEEDPESKFSSIFAIVSTDVVVSRTTSNATSSVVKESDAFFWYPLSIGIGEVSVFRFGVVLVVAVLWSAKRDSVTRANEIASPKIVGFNLKSAHYRADIVISSDEASSGVTYTSISSDDEEPSDAGPEYPEYLALSNAEILVEDQLYAADASPTVLSSSYIVDFDLEDDPEDESEAGPTNYPPDRRDDDDDDSSGDDADDEDEEEASKEDEEEEKHLAPADSTVVSLTVDHVPFTEKTEPFKTDESVDTLPPPLVARILAIPTPPPSPLTPLSSPLPQIPSPPLPLPSPPPSSPLLLPATDRRGDIPEAVFPPRKRLCLSLGPRFEVFSGHTYVPDPEHPPTPEFVPEPVYPEFMTPEDDVLPTEEQPLPAADSPTIDSLGYILESDPEEDPEEDDKDPKEDPTNYPTDRDDDNDE